MVKKLILVKSMYFSVKDGGLTQDFEEARKSLEQGKNVTGFFYPIGGDEETILRTTQVVEISRQPNNWAVETKQTIYSQKDELVMFYI